MIASVIMKDEHWGFLDFFTLEKINCLWDLKEFKD